MLCGWMSFSRNFETVPSKRKSLIYTFSTPRRPDCSTTPLLETEISHSVRRMKITVFKEAMLCHLADKYLRFEKGGGGCCLHLRRITNVGTRRLSLYFNWKGKAHLGLFLSKGFKPADVAYRCLTTEVYVCYWHSHGVVYEDNWLPGRDAV